MRGDGVGVFEGDPFGASKIRSRDDAGTLGEFGERFVVGFEGQKYTRRFEGRDGKHFAGDFEDEIVAPLDLLGGVGKGKAKLSNGFDGVYGHGDFARGQFAVSVSLPRNGGKRNRASIGDGRKRWPFR